MTGVTPAVIGLILLSVAAQIAGIFFMPATKGLTVLVPSLIFAACYAVGIGILARISGMGVDLGLFIPFVAALVPLGAIMIGIVAYGESASMLKIGTLIVACVLIGVANTL